MLHLSCTAEGAGLYILEVSRVTHALAKPGETRLSPWANGLSEDLAIEDIDTTRRVVAQLRKKLELNGERAST